MSGRADCFFVDFQQRTLQAEAQQNQLAIRAATSPEYEIILSFK
jgi:hypothetical protein